MTEPRTRSRFTLISRENGLVGVQAGWRTGRPVRGALVCKNHDLPSFMGLMDHVFAVTHKAQLASQAPFSEIDDHIQRMS